ncbi:PucR family transcriptional regulator [Streptomyces sp. NPDC092296]|uniref:PucR family transcriptional regulator n=1 Tax=Streptomyces sp. NPDC092296 TaxID=3366012 RepID=UPI0037FD2F59
MTTHRPDPPAAGPSLAQLLRLVGPGALEVVAAPRGTEVPVADVVLHDPGEERDGGWSAAGLVLLAVGVEAASPDAEDVLRAADRAGAAAVVLRGGGRGPRSALLAAAERGRTALLTRHRDCDWTAVLGRLRTALAHCAVSGSPALDALRPGDLSGLANTVADLVGGAITIEDPQSRVLAYSRLDHEPDPMRRLTILGQQVPRWRVAELRESGFFQALWSTDDVVRRPADDRYAERLAIAVRLGGEVLGSIWAAADGRPLAEDAVAALRTAARAAVPHLAHHRSWGRAAAREREEAVHALLTGGADPERAAGIAGVEPGRPYAVVVAEAYDSRALGAAGGGGAGEQRVLDVLALQAAAYRPGSVTARSGRRLFVLIPAWDGGGGGGDGGDAGGDPARRLVATARPVPHSVVFAGAGPVAADLAGLPGARETAELVVRVLRERAASVPAASVVSAAAALGEVASEVALLRVLDRVEPLWEGQSGPVHAMVAHDRAHGSEYGESVTAYLDAFGDTGVAARRLKVHANTLRYRLRRAHELFGVDLADPVGRLLADLGLRLARRTG